jgi:hypothetical protein
MKLPKRLSKAKLIGYDMDGNPISEKQFVKDIRHDLDQLSEGKLEIHSSAEVKRKMVG